MAFAYATAPLHFDVRLGDNFEQRRAGTVQINAGVAWFEIMNRLAGILFKVGASDANDFFCAI